MDSSFERLTAPHHRRLYGMALSLCKDPDQASDLTQEALVRAYRKFHTFRQGAPVFPWLARILRNIFLDSFKTGRARHEVAESSLGSPEQGPFLERVPGQEQDPLERIERARLLGWLREEIAALPEDHRLVVTLCDVQGTSYAEAGEVCGVPVGTVKSRVSRARATLRRRMQRRLADRRQNRGPEESMEPGRRLSRNAAKPGTSTHNRGEKVRAK